MKKQIAFSLLPLAVLAIASCGGTPTSESVSGSTSTSTQKETVNLTVWGGEEDQDFLTEVTGSFAAANKTSSLEFKITVGVQSESSAKDTILKDVEAAADVFAFPDDQLNDLVKAGVLQSIDMVDAPLGQEVRTRNHASSVSAALSGETLYAFPMTADNGFFLYYDNTVVSKADTASYDSIFAKLKEKSTTDNFVYKYSMQMDSGWYLDGFFSGAGLQCYLDGATGKNFCDWNSKTATHKGVDVAKAIMNITCGEFANYFIADGDATFASDTGRTDTYRVAAGVNGAWNAPTVSANYKTGYAAGKLPTFKLGGEQIQQRSVSGFKLCGVNKYSDFTGWAVKLGDWITNQQNQTLRFTERGAGPSNTVAASSEAVKANVALSGLIEQNSFGSTQSVASAFWIPSGSLAAALAAGMNGEVDLITSGRGTANLVFNDAAIQEMLDTAVAAITA